MKTLNAIIFLGLFLGSTVYTSAQTCDPLYPVKVGSVIESQNFNAKNKLTGSVRQTILDYQTGVNSSAIKVKSESFDSKGKSLLAQELVMKCENGVFIMDMQNFIDPKSMGNSGNMEVKIDANNMEFPSTMTTGMALKDANIKISMGSNGMTFMNIETKIYNRKVEGIENITTPAGTFECYKISYTAEVKAVVRVTVSTIQYIAKGVGVVRTENYDKKGKLTNYTVISKLTK